MSEEPEKIINMSDGDLRKWTLSGDVESYSLQLGQAEMNMRCSLRMLDATKEMASANRDLVKATNMIVDANQSLIKQTRNLVLATLALVVVTAILIYFQVGRG
ncbi:MAG: hypothetical protein HY648_08080 [Acidobacteria bacterium]|nr:hypothetical protein [Acidobacteriota bacterium]